MGGRRGGNLPFSLVGEVGEGGGVFFFLVEFGVEIGQ